MSTVTSRALSSSRLADKVTINVDAADYEEKTGFIKVAISSVTWTGTGTSSGETFKLDIRVPNFYAQNDTPVVDEAEPVTNGTLSVAQDYVFSVNLGEPGPSVYVQGDKTWDLLNIKTELESETDITDFVVTVTYTVTFEEVDETMISSLDSATLSLNVSDERKEHQGVVALTAETGEGAYVFVPTYLDTLIDDNDTREDSVPNFSFEVLPTSGGYSVGYTVISHPVAKSSSHRKNYGEDERFVVAVNDGKVDANGSHLLLSLDGTTTTKHVVGVATLMRVSSWPSDDTVDGTFAYKVGFVSA